MFNNNNQQVLDTIIESIVEEVRPRVEGKRFHLPEQVDYAFPASEKKFVGNLPVYTAVKLDKNAIVGIHWVNVDGYRVDLDLHYASEKHRVSWCNRFGDRQGIYHSGDMTDAPAPKGAVEAIYISEDITDDVAMLAINRYAGPDGAVPYTLFFGTSEGGEDFGKDYLISNHELMLNINGLEISSSQQSIGIIKSNSDGSKVFYTVAAGFGSGIVAGGRSTVSTAEALYSVAASRLSLRDVLSRAGALFVADENGKWDFDLSLAALSKDSFSFLWA